LFFRPFRANRRLAVTLFEVMIASTIALGITITAISSSTYFAVTTSKNDRAERLRNLMEGQLEKILSQTWYNLSDPTTGLFRPNGPSSANPTWPPITGPFTRYKSNALSINLVNGTTLTQDYTGLNGKVEVFYTPFTYQHRATNKAGTAVGYTVNYYKVELVISLDPGNRIRRGDPSQPDVWTAVTYISEITSRSDAEFSQKILQQLRERAQPL
jgi:hypothetical protein